MKTIILGLGAVGLPFSRLLSKTSFGSANNLLCIDREREKGREAESFGAISMDMALDSQTDIKKIGALLGPGDFLVNLACDVDCAMLAWACRKAGAFYMDAGLDRWLADAGGLSSAAENRQRFFDINPPGEGPAALIGQGANPGLASQWAFFGIETLAGEHGLDQSWSLARKAAALGLRAIQIAEKDWSEFNVEHPGKRLNTWSIHGLCREGLLRGEIGWGSLDGADRPPIDIAEFSKFPVGLASTTGFSTKIKTWTPLGGQGVGMAISHLEASGISRRLDWIGNRPSCCYAYQPCQAASAWIESGDTDPAKGGLVPHWSQTSGIDELGALLLGERFGSLWVGSALANQSEACKRLEANATCVQVCAGLWAGIMHLSRNPRAGTQEPEDLDFRTALADASSLLGEPLAARSCHIEPLDIPAPAHKEALSFHDFIA